MTKLKRISSESYVSLTVDINGRISISLGNQLNGKNTSLKITDFSGENREPKIIKIRGLFDLTPLTITNYTKIQILNGEKEIYKGFVTTENEIIIYYKKNENVINFRAENKGEFDRFKRLVEKYKIKFTDFYYSFENQEIYLPELPLYNDVSSNKFLIADETVAKEFKLRVHNDLKFLFEFKEDANG